MTGTTWMEAAACAGVVPDLWHADDAAAVEQGRAVCRACPVRADCLDHAIAHSERWGMWGGLTEPERRPLLRRRLVAVRADDRYSSVLCAQGDR